MKWIKRIVLAVVALLIVAVVIIYFSLNSIICKVVQQQASASLNVPTTLGSAKLSLFGGTLTLNDLNISSPSPFVSAHIFALNGIKVAVNYSQLRDNPIHIKQIVIDNPDLVIEQNNGNLNIQALMQKPSQTPTTSSGQPAAPLKLVIDELDLNNAKVEFQSNIPGLSKPMSITIPSLVLKNVGNADGTGGGEQIKQVVMQAITSLASNASAKGDLPPEVTQALNGQLSQVTQALSGDLNKQLQKVAGPLGDQLPPVDLSQLGKKNKK